MKRYLLRSLKYFLKLTVILVLILAVLATAKMVPSKIDEMFVNGYDSLWQIALIIAGLSLLYPRFGYGRRSAFIPGEPGEVRSKVVKAMAQRGFIPEDGTSDPMVFRSNSTYMRILRLGEDAVTLEKTATGYDVEGKVKDIARVAAFLETIYSTPDETV